MTYNGLYICINSEENPYRVRLGLPRNKGITIDDISFIYNWDEEGIYLKEWKNRALERKDVFSNFYDFNRIFSFLYKFNIGLINDERIYYYNEKMTDVEEYTGKNQNMYKLKDFFAKYRSLPMRQKRRLDCCINLFNKSVYFSNELQLREEAYIYLYKIIEIISNEVVNKEFISQNLKGINNDNNLDMLIKKYLCEENGINNYQDIVAAIKKKLEERYNSATIKIYHLNKNIKTNYNINDMNNIRDIVKLRNNLSHENPQIDNEDKFNEIFHKVFQYVPELICSHYLGVNYKDICCSLKVEFDDDVILGE